MCFFFSRLFPPYGAYLIELLCATGDDSDLEAFTMGKSLHSQISQVRHPNSMSVLMKTRESQRTKALFLRNAVHSLIID